MMLNYRDELDFITAWTIIDANETDLYKMIKPFLFQQGSKIFSIKQESSLRTHMFEVFNLIFFKQQLFLNILDHIDVTY